MYELPFRSAFLFHTLREERAFITPVYYDYKSDNINQIFTLNIHAGKISDLSLLKGSEFFIFSRDGKCETL